MNIKKIIDLAAPNIGYQHLWETYLIWSGVGFVSSFIAGGLDRYSGVAYATYYTGAVNDAVGFKFWVLLAVIGLLLFCTSLPLLYLSRHVQAIGALADRLRRATHTFFLVAFGEGALMIGILMANFLHASDKTALLASKSFLFSDVGLFVILMLVVLNALLWLIGESIYNRNDKGYSGVVALLMQTPIKYALPVYTVCTGLVVQIIVGQ